MTNHRILVSAGILSCIFTTPLLCQSDRQPAFEVASVKADNSAAPPHSNFPLGPGDAYTPTGGLFSATNFPLATYIAFAYKLIGSQLQYLDLPHWVMEERFDVDARALGNPTKDQMRLMMRSLLADRFKLAMHNGTRDVPVAALIVVKGGKLGPRLRPHPSDSSCPLDAAPPSRTNPGGVIDGGFPTLCGGLLMLPPSVPGRVRAGARNVTLPFIANALSGVAMLERPIVDRTGLAGNFDFNLEWTPEIHGPIDPNVEIDATGPTFEQALRDQLGLKVESQRGTVPVFVLDHVERPTEN